MPDIPLSKINPNPKNPRRVITLEMIDNMAASLAAVGLKNDIKLNVLPDGSYEIISGHIRFAGAQRLGWETISAELLTLAPDQALLESIMDNRGQPMNWLETAEAVESLMQARPKPSQEAVGKIMGIPQQDVSRKMVILSCLTPAAREAIYTKSVKTFEGGLIPQKVVEAFTGLNEPERIEGCLNVAIDRKMTEPEAKRLVVWVNAGNPPSRYTRSKAPKTPNPVQPNSVPHANGHHQEPLAQSNHAPQHAASAQTPPADNKADSSMELAHPSHAPQPEVSNPDTHSVSGQSNHAPQHVASAQTQAEPGWFWQWMVGIPFISRLRSKVKKGETPTNTEKILLLGYQAWKFFAPMRKEIGKLFKEMVKGFLHSVKKALGKTAKSILDFVLPLILIGLLIWGILAFFHFAVISPLHWIENKIGSVFHHEDITQTPIPAPVSAPPPVASASRPPAEKRALSVPISHKQEIGASQQVYQPAVSFAPIASPSQTLYDPKLLEQEIAAIPKNSIVKAFPLSPDEGMPGDLAVSRMQGVTDPDKYTMKIGSGTQKIISITTTTTNLIIIYKSTDPFSILDSAGPLNFFWEDVKYIHSDELDVQGNAPSVFYQCSLIVSGSKTALTIQCASADDLKHLVSTMEYFIRNSRLGHDTALAGMPYPSQGLLLNNDGMVEKLWAESPMDKVGVTLGDHLWSIGKVTSEKQSRNDLEAGLQSYANGNNNGPLAQPNLAPRLVGSAQVPITFFAASPAEWNRALLARDPSQANSFRPKLRKVVLNAP
jgi:ParB/RepB/Spo0J family partition protein